MFLVVTCAFYLSTYLPRNIEDSRLQQLESDLNAITVTVPQSDTTEITQFSHSLGSTSEIGDDDDISSRRDPEDDQTNQPSEILTDADISTLISEMKEQRDELHQAYEEKRELSLLAQDELFAHSDAFDVEFEANLARHNAIQEKFELEVLGGRSVHEVVTTASHEELEEFRAHPQSQVLTEACLRQHKLRTDYNAQSKALADMANALSAEAGALSIQVLEIDNDIADLKAMLE